MKLMAWRSTCPNPCDDPKVSISIAPAEGAGTRNVFPWVLPIEEARYIFGPIVDEKITETPVEVVLYMSFPPVVTPGVQKILDTLEEGPQ
jgi:hypothetical protein